VDGERAEPPTAGRLAREDAIRSAPDDRVGDVRRAIEASPYTFALVTGASGMLLGRVRASELDDADDGETVGEIMELDPSTVRSHRAAGGLAEQLAEQDLRWAIVTTPEGRLLGVAWREDLEGAAAAEATDQS
jgi:Mg/Co/Ni transporter MgtE